MTKRRTTESIVITLLCLLGGVFADDTISLQGQHAFHHGDNLAWAEPSFDDSSWPEISVPAAAPAKHGWAAGGFGWYRIRFQTPVDHTDLSVWLGQVNSNDETYLNGSFIGRTGNFDGAQIYAPPQIRCYHLPEHLLAPAGQTNVLAIRVYCSTEDLGLAEGPVKIGQRLELEPRAKRQNFMIETAIGATWALTAAGLVIVLTFCLRGGANRMNRWLLVVLFSMFVYIPFESLTLANSPARNHPAMIAFAAIAAASAVAAVIPTILAALNGRMRWWLWTALGMIAVVTAAYIIGTPDLRTDTGLAVAAVVNWLTAIAISIIGGHVIVLCILRLRRGERDARILGWTLGISALLMVFSFREIGAGIGIGTIATYTISYFLMPVFLAGLVIVGINRALADKARVAVLSSRVIAAQNEERNRIGRQLHDGVTQDLIAIRLGLQRAGGVDEPLESLKSVIEQVRDLSHELRPGQLEESSLADAFFRHAAQFNDLELKLEADSAAAEGFSDDEKHQLFRIFQEAVGNAVKHGNATQIQIWLSLSELRIKDNGHGQKPKTIEGIGLKTMQERAELMGATFEIQFKRGKGTTIIVDMEK